MQDRFGREIQYLRMSVTDRCNYRCVYCMPPEVVEKKEHGQPLSLEEILEIARAAVGLGVRKLRLTGGEPLMRRGLPWLCTALAELPGVEDLAMTTNGALLAPVAKELREAGLRRVNISLDTLDPQKFARITRGGRLADVLAGIEAAANCGLTPIKLNTVLLRGINEEEIPALVELTRCWPVELRLIEWMPVGGTGRLSAIYAPDKLVLERVPELESLNRQEGVARLYRLPGALGTVGLIAARSNHFCNTCDRLRLTADGKLKPCLHSPREIPVRGLTGQELERAILQAVQEKPVRHPDLSRGSAERLRNMNEIGG